MTSFSLSLSFLRSLTVTSCYCVPLGDSLSCLRSSLLPLSLSPSLHLLMPLLLSQHCGALFFYSTHFTHPSLFFTFSLYLSAVTHSLRGYISRPKREGGWEQRKKHTDTHSHINTSTFKRARKFALTLLLGTKTFETHLGQLQYWITTAGRSDVCVSVVWGGRGPGQTQSSVRAHGTPAPPDWELFRDFCSQRRDTCPLLSTSLSSRENHSAERNWPSGPWR